jgi:hypothetical protein
LSRNATAKKKKKKVKHNSASLVPLNHMCRQILIKFDFSQLIFIKVSNIEYHENRPSGNRINIGGQTEGNDKPIGAFRDLCERV